MSIEKNTKDALKIIFAVIVLPLLMTVIFSRVVLKKEVLGESYTFSIFSPFDEYLKFDCGIENCNLQSSENFKASRNFAQVLLISAKKEDLERLRVYRDSVIEKIGIYAGLAECRKDPIEFSSGILVRKLITGSIPDFATDDFYKLLTLGRSVDKNVLQKNAEAICNKLEASMRNYFVSEIVPTRLGELKGLKIASIFYMSVAFLAFIAFYLYPEYRRRNK